MAVAISVGMQVRVLADGPDKKRVGRVVRMGPLSTAKLPAGHVWVSLLNETVYGEHITAYPVEKLEGV